MSTANLVTTRREPGQPERRHPQIGKQPMLKLRAQVKNLSRGDRARAQVKANGHWQRLRSAQELGLQPQPPQATD